MTKASYIRPGLRRIGEANDSAIPSVYTEADCLNDRLWDAMTYLARSIPYVPAVESELEVKTKPYERLYWNGYRWRKYTNYMRDKARRIATEYDKRKEEENG